MAYSGGAYAVNYDEIIYTVERTVFLGHFEIAIDHDIIFTKVFSKNNATQQTTTRQHLKVYNIIGYSLFSLVLASSVVNCQSTPFCV